MKLAISVLALGLLVSAPGAMAKDAAVGVWKTQPDRKKLTSHIGITQCGAKLCGKVLEAFDIYGKPARTRNVGRQLFWDMEALGNGKYGNGTVFVPLLNIKAKATMKLTGNRLKVTGCKGPVCDGQVWTRLK